MASSLPIPELCTAAPLDHKSMARMMHFSSIADPDVLSTVESRDRRPHFGILVGFNSDHGIPEGSQHNGGTIQLCQHNSSASSTFNPRYSPS